MQPSPAGGEFGRLQRVLLKRPEAAFRSQADIGREWRALSFIAAPDYAAAQREYDTLVTLIQQAGPVDIVDLPFDQATTLDSIYVRDASLVTPGGLVFCRMGKAARESEPAAQRRTCEALGIPVAGAVVAPGTIEGGDVIWLDERTIAVGRGYRTNDEGIRQLRAVLGNSIDELIVVPLPHWHGPGDVFHLMSMISPVDDDLAVVFKPLMPVPFLETLAGRGMEFVEVPHAEFGTMGANVLAIAPRECIMVAGNPITQSRLEAAGARVHVYDGANISVKGEGGPTCLTRPLVRAESTGHRAKGSEKEEGKG